MGVIYYIFIYIIILMYILNVSKGLCAFLFHFLIYSYKSFNNKYQIYIVNNEKIFICNFVIQLAANMLCITITNKIDWYELDFFLFLYIFKYLLYVIFIYFIISADFRKLNIYEYK